MIVRIDWKQALDFEKDIVKDYRRRKVYIEKRN